MCCNPLTKKDILSPSAVIIVVLSNQIRQASSIHQTCNSRCNQEPSHSQKSVVLTISKMINKAWWTRPKFSLILNSTKYIDQIMILRSRKRSNNFLTKERDNHKLEVSGNLWTHKWRKRSHLPRIAVCMLRATKKISAHSWKNFLSLVLSLVNNRENFAKMQLKA